jgi:hypothetical protein
MSVPTLRYRQGRCGLGLYLNRFHDTIRSEQEPAWPDSKLPVIWEHGGKECHGPGFPGFVLVSESKFKESEAR